MIEVDTKKISDWVDQHFDEQVKMLQELVKVPSDTPPGNNAPHALRTAALLTEFDMKPEEIKVPDALVKQAGFESVTNLLVKRRYGKGGPIVALNAHGDVVPPGEGWSKPPYGGVIENGKLYGRAAAVSKCDFTTYSFAVRAIEALGLATRGGIDLTFTYDEECGGELGPGYLLEHGFTKPDLLIAAGFSYQIVTGHNGCLQLEVNVHGKMSHAAIPDSGIDALKGANAILTALYNENERYRREVKSKVEGISHPYINVGQISGGINTNVVPGHVRLKVDRRMIPEEDPTQVEAQLIRLIEEAVTKVRGCSVEIKRILLARALKPLAGNKVLVEPLQKFGKLFFGEDIPAGGTPLYTDARLYCEAGIPAVLYGAGPRTVLESNAKRADEHIVLEDLRRATKVVACSLASLLG